MLEKIIELTAETLGANAAEITAETSFMAGRIGKAEYNY